VSYITNQWVKMNPFEAAARLNELERENAALRAAGDKLRDALISELKEVQAVAEMFGDPESPHVKKLTAVIEQWNAAMKEAQP